MLRVARLATHGGSSNGTPSDAGLNGPTGVVGIGIAVRAEGAGLSDGEPVSAGPPQLAATTAPSRTSRRFRAIERSTTSCRSTATRVDVRLLQRSLRMEDSPASLEFFRSRK